MKFWRKKVAVKEVRQVHQARELTGIEKAELEEEKAREVAKAKALQARREVVMQEIAQIQSQIGPQMQRLQQLKDELDPWTAQYRMLASAQQQNMGMANYYGQFFDVLRGGMGAK